VLKKRGRTKTSEILGSRLRRQNINGRKKRRPKKLTQRQNPDWRMPGPASKKKKVREKNRMKFEIGIRGDNVYLKVMVLKPTTRKK